jgi:succinoglycan biosynthesis protein ExoO
MAMSEASMPQDMTERPRQDQSAGPDVSFVVAAFNAAPYIEAAMASALAQTGVAVEVIVVDDASSDDTAAIVAAVAARDPRVTLIRRVSNGGPSVSRNEAMRRTRGAWIAVLDADDLIAAERSRRLIDLAETTSADVVGDNFARFSADPEAPASTMIPASPVPYYFFVDVAAFLRGNAMFDAAARLGYIKLMFRQAFLRSRGIEHLEEVVIGEDYHLGLSCLLEGARFVVSSETLYKYRVRDGSLSWRLRTEDIEQLLRSHDELGIERRFGGNAQILEAAGIYRRSLVTAREVASAIEQAKHGRWQGALAGAAAHPRTWPLLARFVGEAAAKRLGVQ